MVPACSCRGLHLRVRAGFYVVPKFIRHRTDRRERIAGESYNVVLDPTEDSLTRRRGRGRPALREPRPVPGAERARRLLVDQEQGLQGAALWPASSHCQSASALGSPAASTHALYRRVVP